MGPALDNEIKNSVLLLLLWHWINYFINQYLHLMRSGIMFHCAQTPCSLFVFAKTKVVFRTFSTELISSVTSNSCNSKWFYFPFRTQITDTQTGKKPYGRVWQTLLDWKKKLCAVHVAQMSVHFFDAVAKSPTWKTQL